MDARQWLRPVVSDEKKQMMVSTDPKLLSHAFVQAAFAHPDMYWATPMSANDVRTMLSNSLTLGLYERDQSEGDRDGAWTQIGMARMITDSVTFAYVTDVFVQPGHQGSGLGKWLILCCREIIDQMPALRRAMLLTKPDGKSMRFYQDNLGMQAHDEKSGLVVMTTKAGI